MKSQCWSQNHLWSCLTTHLLQYNVTKLAQTNIPSGRSETLCPVMRNHKQDSLRQRWPSYAGVCGGHQVMTFKPAISKRAHELPSRSFEELSEGDRLRRDCYLVSHLSVFCNTICCLSTQSIIGCMSSSPSPFPPHPAAHSLASIVSHQGCCIARPVVRD